MTVHVLQDGIEFTGEIESQGRNGTETRLTVARPDGVKVFVYPERPDVSVTDILVVPDTGGPTPVSSRPGDPPIQPVGSHGPATGMDPPGPTPQAAPLSLPSVGTSIAGVPLTPTHPPAEAGPVRKLPPSDLLNDTLSHAPVMSRFIVQSSKGRPKVFHTRPDCPRVSGDAPQLPVDDDGIAFFDLSVCQACERRDSQITFEEALHDALVASVAPLVTMDQVRKVATKVKGWGFSISPSAVDR